MNPALYALIPAFAIADRIWGGDVKHGRRYSIVLAFASGLGFGWLADGMTGMKVGAAMSLAFLLTRSLGFHAFGGSATPRKGGQFLGLVLRHALLTVGVAVALSVALLGKPPLLPGLTFAGWALFAGALGLFYGEVNDRAKRNGRPIAPLVNQVVEIMRGAAFGLALASMWAVSAF